MIQVNPSSNAAQRPMMVEVNAQDLAPLNSDTFNQIYSLLSQNPALSQAYLGEVKNYQKKLQGTGGEINLNDLQGLSRLLQNIAADPQLSGTLTPGEAAQFQQALSKASEAADGLRTHLILEQSKDAKAFVEKYLGGEAHLDGYLAVFLVMLDRADELSNITQSQIKGIQGVNDQLNQVNQSLAQVRSLQSQAGEKGTRTMPPAVLELLRKNGISTKDYEGSINSSRMNALIEHLNSIQTNLTSDTSLKMTLLNQTVGQESARYEAIKTASDKNADTRSRISGNIRK